MYVVPPQYRTQRTPGQVPSREAMQILRDAEKAPPSPKLTAERLLSQDQPVLTPAGVLKGLGLDDAQEQGWRKFLGTFKGEATEIGARQSLMQKIQGDKLEPTLRNVLFQRAMSYYRSRMQKSGTVTVDGQQCMVFTPTELAKARAPEEEIPEKVMPDRTNKHRMQMQRKADRELAKKRKQEEKALTSKPNGQSVAPTPGESGAPLRVEPVAGNAAVKKSQRAEVVRFYLASPAERRRLIEERLQGKQLRKGLFSLNIELAKKYAPEHVARLEEQQASLAKAEPRGGSYHKRVTDPKTGKHKYFYDPDKYAKHPEAHVDGAEAMKGYIRKQIERRLDERGECSIEDFRDLAERHGAEHVGALLKDGCGSKAYEFRKGKFRKCQAGAPAMEKGERA